MILGIDTALQSCSIGLFKDGQTIAKHVNEDAFKASEVLHNQIRQLLNANGLTLKDLQGIAVNGGPGSYTGLRIGATTAKGLCYALDIPLIHIDGFKLMTHGVIARDKQTDFEYYIPMIDARRMEVFTVILDRSMKAVSTAGPVILTETDLQTPSVAPTLVFGNGAEKAKGLLKGDHYIYHDHYNNDISDMAAIVQEQYDSGNFADVFSYAPNYLKGLYSKGSGN